MSKRKLVLLIFPPNTDKPDVQSIEDGIAPRSGTLTLASALKRVESVEPVYIDGDIYPIPEICEFITLHRDEILAVCIGPWSSGYGMALKLFAHARAENPNITTILGSAHFTAFPELCLRNQEGLIDYGLVGNEVVGSLCQVIGDLARGLEPRPCPGLMYCRDGLIVSIPQEPEAIFTALDYSLLDGHLPHAARYQANFREHIVPHRTKIFGRVAQGFAFIEIARGCIKFKNADACSFCCLSRGGMWKNHVSGSEAWDAIRLACDSGVDTFFFVTDELPLTFRSLLMDMKHTMPAWFRDMPEDERPVFEGYARADGLVVPSNASLLFDVGFRNMFIGVDAGPVISLKAANKQLNLLGRNDSAEKLYAANHQACRAARAAGLTVEIGYVLGHLGATPELLDESAALWNALVDDNIDTIMSTSVEVLQPLPGSADFQCVIDPELATQRSRSLGLEISDPTVRADIAQRWRDKDLIDGRKIQADYAAALMPELSFDYIDQTIARMNQVAERHDLDFHAFKSS